jgi:hypothetical protein
MLPITISYVIISHDHSGLGMATNLHDIPVQVAADSPGIGLLIPEHVVIH